MKKVINYLFIPALLIASAFSCTNVREVEVEVGSAVTTISAYMDEASTKTGYVIDEQNHVARFNWLESDQIDVAVKMGDSYTPVRFLAKEAGFKASFKEAAGDGEPTLASLRAVNPAAELGDMAYYPSRGDAAAQDNGTWMEWEVLPSGNDIDAILTIPSVLNANMGNPLSTIPLLGWRDPEGEYCFKPATAVLAIPVKNITPEMDFISISHETAALSGSFSEHAGITQDAVLSGAGHSLKLVFSGLDGDCTFFFPVAAGEIPAGLNIRCGDSSDPDNQMSLTTKNAVVLNSGHIGRCGAITFATIDQQWADFATGTFKDDFIWSMHSWSETVPVTIQRSGLHPEKYRIANPYATACTAFGYTPYTDGISGDEYFVYRIEDGAVSYQNMVLGMEDKPSNGKPLMINYRPANAAYTCIVRKLTSGEVLEIQFAAYYSNPNDASYYYTKDNFDGTPKIHLVIDDNSPESWNSIGTCSFIDNFVWPYAGLSEPVEREIQQFSHDAARFRIAKPYPAEDADEWFEFNVSNPKKVTSVNYYTGVTVADETKPEVTWKAVVWNGAYGYDYSNVVSTQANGLPAAVQIGPCYRDSEGRFSSLSINDGKYDYEVGKDHSAHVIDIIFPQQAENWESLGTGRYTDQWMWKANGFAPYDVEVEIWRSDLNANRYRLENPYLKANTAFKRTAGGEGDEYMYLTVDPSTGLVTFGSVVTGMSRQSVAVEQTKNFGIADAATWEAIKAKGSAISASESKVIAGSNDAPKKIQLYCTYYDSADVTYFYTNQTGYKYVWFPGAYLEGETWSDYLEGTYTDSLYDIKINNSTASPTLGTLPVMIQRSNLDSRRYRIANPYRGNVAEALRCATYDEYLYMTVENGLVYFEPFRPGIVFDASPKELGFVHPVFLNQHETQSSRGTSLMTNSAVKTTMTDGSPKTVELGPFYYDVATPNFGYNYPRHASAQYPEQRIFIAFDATDKAVMEHYAYPMISDFHNPVAALSLPSGTLQKLVFKVTGIDPASITGLRLYQGGWMDADYVALDANGVVTMDTFTNATVSGTIDLNLWYSGNIMGSALKIEMQEAVVDGVSLPISQDNTVSNYPGVRVNHGGDEVSVRGSAETVSAFRIPALVTSNSGTLIAAYDVRYDHSGDLQADIDVGVKRSTDGGKTWGPLALAMDMGVYGYEDQIAAGTMTAKQAQQQNGIGDPCLLVDENTGELFCFAVWTHGHPGERSLSYAGTGYEIEDTPQYMMVRSTDDGVTWSAPENITRQVKKYDWCMTFQGPGRGITMKDGTLVVPMQHQENGVLNSGIMYSKDHGLSWHAHEGFARHTTSECAVAEITPGTLMLTMRDETNSRYRAVYTTTDLGRTWTPHSTDGKVIEPTCEASLLHVDANKNSLGKDLLLFSNPASQSGRSHITIKASLDQGETWPYALTVDEGGGWGYSCLTMVDSGTVGILYESSKGHIVFQAVPLQDIVK